ncbi:hypothetical protein [Paraliobacillus sediminis]|uniref:hypothetical protein n=1 Tax=Paraliobacillus sediminis TaxID=1885916 RepID=UPI000E3C7AEE|nr:hypothetical protein [Paraliobacillus sediminis]
MECLSTRTADHAIVDDFFQDQWPDGLNEQAIWEYGYLVKHEKVAYAFFMLQPVEENALWLNNFYIKQVLAPSYVLGLIEICMEVARKKEASKLYVHSQQKAIRDLVEQLGFELIDQPTFQKESIGEWWMIRVDK